MPLSVKQVTDLIARSPQSGQLGTLEALRRQHQQEVNRGGGNRTTGALIQQLMEQVRAHPIPTRRPGGYVHPATKAKRATPATVRQPGEAQFSLSAADILWLQRLPVDPGQVTYEDAVALAGLANQVQRGTGDERLIASIWGPVKELHDRRDVEVNREAVRRPLPDFPRTAAVDVVADALRAELDQLTDDERRARAEQIVDDALATRAAQHGDQIAAADRALDELNADRTRRARLHEVAPDQSARRPASPTAVGENDKGRAEAQRRYGVPA